MEKYTAARGPLSTDQLVKLAKMFPEVLQLPDRVADLDADAKVIALDEFAYSLAGMLHICGDVPSREGLQDTPFRFIKALLENTSGLREDPEAHLQKTFDVTCDELILVKDIEFYSMCEHHLAPFFGVAHVAYIPRDNTITGLSKVARMVEGYAKRFQVQERLTSDIAEAMVRVLDPLGVAVVVEAKHMCMCARGIKKSTAKTVTSAMRGVFRENNAARAEITTLIKG